MPRYRHATDINVRLTSVGQLLERLFRNVEPLEDLLVFRVCIIYLDCLYFGKQASTHLPTVPA